MSNALAVGFYGKLPILGDFVRRQVADRTVVAWDAWLQQAVAASRDRLGDAWLQLYLTAPMWRFFAQPGVLDEQPVCGVLFPSVDRVGRHFPFTVFARLPRRCVGLVVADRCAAWFERVEDLVLAHLEDDSRTVDALDEAIGATAERLAAAIDTLPENLTPGGLHDLGAISDGCVHLSLGNRVDVTPTALFWLEKSISHAMPDAVFWWSSGSASVAALVAHHAWTAGAARILSDAFRRLGRMAVAEQCAVAQFRADAERDAAGDAGAAYRVRGQHSSRTGSR